MKILQVIDTLNIGGAERVFVDVCNILKENDQDVSALILLENKGKLAKELNIPIIDFSRNHKWDIVAMYRCSQILNKYEIVHCHLRHVYRYIALVNLVFRSKAKIVFQDHYGSIGVDTSIPFLFNIILKPSYYIGVSQTLTDWAIEKVQLKQKNVFLLQNIIRKLETTEATTKSSDLLLVSNIKPIKNNAFAIQVAKELRLSLLIIGRNQNDAYYNELLNEIDHKVIKINESISKAQLVMGSAMIGLHTSKSETGPLVLIEYLAQGLPFVAYKTGEVAQMLANDFPEFFIDNFEIHEWKEKVQNLLDNSFDRSKMKRVFEQHFGEQQYYTKLKNIYLCVIKE